MDTVVAEALAQRLGHGEPFEPDELARLDGVVRLVGAHSLDGLEGCRGLEQLSVHAGDVQDLSVIAGLPALRRLRITCTPVADLSPLAGHPALEQVELLFTFAEDVTPLLALPMLRRAELVGNPWTGASFRRLPELSERFAAAGDRGGLVCSDEWDWKMTRKLRDRDEPGCFGTLPRSLRTVLVRPGRVSMTGRDCDFRRIGPSALSNKVRKAHFSVAALLDQVTTGEPPLFAEEEQVVIGGAAEARTWIAGAELPVTTRRSLGSFVDRFPQLSFTRYTPDWLARSQQAGGVQLPDWMQQLWQFLGRVHHGEIAYVRLAGFDGWSPRADGVSTSWYSWPHPGFNNDDERALLAPTGLVPICQQMDEESVLAIRTADGDRRVYELHLEDAWDDHSDHGGLPADYGRPVFDDYLRLIDNIRAVRLPETGRVIEASA